MKYFLGIGLGFLILWSCSTSNKTTATGDLASTEDIALNSKVSDTVRIANDSLEYEIIIIDPKFSNWLVRNTIKPRGYYTQKYLETKNDLLVTNYNIRVQNPVSFDPNLYQLTIDYRPEIDYGYEVNYLLYNYFVFFQLSNNVNLAGFVPRL